MEKTIRPYLTQLAATIHGNAVQHGFWEGNYSDGHYLTLVVCELAEAVEADRKGNKADVECYKVTMLEWEDMAERIADPQQYQYELKSNFELYIKDTVEDELADAVIRLLDLAGAYKCDMERVCLAYVVNSCNTFTENIYAIIKELVTYKRSHSIEERLNYALLQIEKLALQMGIDLWWHVKAKMEYNASRPYKHNKKY